MTWLVRDIQLNKMEWFSVVDSGASGNAKHRAKIVLWKRNKQAVPLAKQESTMPPTIDEILAKLSPEEAAVVQQALAVAAAPVAPTVPLAAAAPAPVAPVPVAKAEGEEEKKVPVEVQKRLDDTKAEKLELEKRVKTLEDEAKMIEFEKRATTLDKLPMGTKDLAVMLRDVSNGLDAKASAGVLTMLTKVNKSMAESPIFQQYGSDAEGGATESPLQKRDRMVIDLRKQNPKMSAAKARTEVYRADPELWREVEAATHAA